MYLQRLLEAHVSPNAVTIFEVPTHRIRNFRNFAPNVSARGLLGGIISKAESETGYFIVGSEEPFFVVWQSVREFVSAKRNSVATSADDGHRSFVWVFARRVIVLMLVTMLAAVILY